MTPIGIRLYCSSCDALLNVLAIESGAGGVSLAVQPCQRCLAGLNATTLRALETAFLAMGGCKCKGPAIQGAQEALAGAVAEARR